MPTQPSPLAGLAPGASGTGRALASSLSFAAARGRGRGAEATSGFEEAREALRREERETRLARGDRGLGATEDRRTFTSRETKGSKARDDQEATDRPPSDGIRRAGPSDRGAPTARADSPGAPPSDGSPDGAAATAGAPGEAQGLAGVDEPGAPSPPGAPQGPAAAPGAGPAGTAPTLPAALYGPAASTAASGSPSAGPALEAAAPSTPEAPGAGIEGAATRGTPPATGGPASAAAPSASAGPDPSIAEAAEVLRQLKAELHRGLRRVRVDLDPPELGRLVVRVALQQGVLRAVVEADSPATLDLLQRQAPELRAALAEHGVAAEGLTLRLGSEPSHEGAQRHGARRGAGQRAAHSIEERVGEPVGPLARTSTHLLDNDSGVDTYA